MQQLVRLVDPAVTDWGTGLTSCIRDHNAYDLPYLEEVKKLQHFASVGSQFYPERTAWYEEEAQEWFDDDAEYLRDAYPQEPCPTFARMSATWHEDEEESSIMRSVGTNKRNARNQ